MMQCIEVAIGTEMGTEISGMMFSVSSIIKSS